MPNKIVRITRNLSYNQVQSGEISPIEAYRIQVTDWILGPAYILAKEKPHNTDCGMAILALELMFFEPHGQFLDPATTRSRERFCLSFDRFLEYLKTRELLPANTTDLSSVSIYKWARCGLFHSSLLSNELLVDAVGFARRPLAKNTVLQGWLVDPWLLLDSLKEYLDLYVAEVKDKPNSARAVNFKTTFDQLFSKPLQQFP